MIVGLQQPIFSFIQSSEERTNNAIQQIRDKIILQQLAQDNLNQGMNEFLNKYKHNSSSKGIVSECQLYSILQLIFPSDEIIDCSNETATCDYRVNRLSQTKPTILFENKDYTRSVTSDEVKKFERDLKQQQQHGIFISHNSNITFKEPYQIDVIDGFIHLYLPNAQYDHQKIKAAVDIVDKLAYQLSLISNTNEQTYNVQITKEDIDELLQTYNDFAKQKATIIEDFKKTCKLTIEGIERMEMPIVRQILCKNGLIQIEASYNCPYCNLFVGKNKGSISAHKRNCKKYKAVMSTAESQPKTEGTSTSPTESDTESVSESVNERISTNIHTFFGTECANQITQKPPKKTKKQSKTAAAAKPTGITMTIDTEI